MNGKRNQLFSEIWRACYPVLTYYGVYYFVFILAGILGLTFSMVALERSGAVIDYYLLVEETANWIARYSVEISACTALLALVPLTLYFRMDSRQHSETAFVYEPVNPAGFVLALLLGAAACLAVNSLMHLSGLMGTYAENADEVAEALYQGHLIPELIGIGVLTPVAEELLFRGLVMRRLKEWLPPQAALVASAVVFGLYHGNLLQVLYGTAMGLLFGFLYEKYHHILAPVLAHIGANLVSVAASESGILDGVLREDFSLIACSALSCLALVGLLWAVEKWINPSLVQSGTESTEEPPEA